MSASEPKFSAAKSVSVILCTFNRSDMLGATLEDLAAQRMPGDIEWEVMVVDNNSSDRTRDIAQDFCRRFPERFRYFFEGTQGKSYALNTGIRHARGKVLAFIDDDVKVDPAWISEITGALHDGKWAGAGGRTCAAEKFSAPDWFSDEKSGGILYGRFDFGDEPRELDWAPYGANMAYRADMFAKYGGFRLDLGPGPDPTIPRPNEDTEIGRRLMAAGEHIRYEPKAVLYHPVALDRLHKPFFLKFWYDYGRASARELKKPPVAGIDRDYLSLLKLSLVSRPAEWILSVFASNAAEKFWHQCRMRYFSGRFSETRRRLRGGNAEVGVTETKLQRSV